METFAIVQTGGKQMRVEPEQLIAIERVTANSKKEVVLDKVLALGGEKSFEIGSPFVKGASVVCEFIREKKGPKTVIFKMKRRKNYRRKKGHRQLLSELRVKKIQTPG